MDIWVEGGRENASVSLAEADVRYLIQQLAKVDWNAWPEAKSLSEKLTEAVDSGDDLSFTTRQDRKLLYAALTDCRGLVDTPCWPLNLASVAAVEIPDMERIHRRSHKEARRWEKEQAKAEFSSVGRYIAPARVFLYWKLMPVPHIELRGLGLLSLDDLYGGGLLASTTAWWNAFLDKRPAFAKYHIFQAYDSDSVSSLQSALNPANRPFFLALAQQRSPLARNLSVACLALSYAFARTLMGAINDAREEAFAPAEEIDLDLWESYNKRFTIVADYYGYQESPGWWAEREVYAATTIAIRAMRWAYGDQVRRWEKAHGSKLGAGIGFAPLEESNQPLLGSFADRLFEEGGRVYDAEHLGETG